MELTPHERLSAPGPVSVEIGELVISGADQRFENRWTSSFRNELGRLLDGAQIGSQAEPETFGSLTIQAGTPESMGRETARQIARRLVQ